MDEAKIKKIWNDKSKHIKEEERGSHDSLQKNQVRLIDNIKSSC